MMKRCNFVCSILLLLAVFSSFGAAKHAKLPDLFDKQPSFSAEYCEKLQRECDKGICTKCCEQFTKGCDPFKDVSDSEIEIARSEKELEDQIRKINAEFKGEEGIEKLVKPVVLEDGSTVQLHRREDLEEIFDIKNVVANGDEMDTPFFGLDAILTLEQARSVWNHSKQDNHRRTKRHNMVVGRRTVHKWPQTVHYVFDETAARDPRTVRTTRSVAGYMNQHSCLNMVHGLPSGCSSGGASAGGGGSGCPNNYIVVVGGGGGGGHSGGGGGGGGCSSNVGMTGGAQAVHLGQGCGQFGIGYRQFSHALGASTVPGCTTFAPQPQPVPVVGQAALTPSFCNMQYLNNLYCAGSCGQQQNTCWNGGYLNPANCASCMCPPGYSGSTCGTPCGGTGGGGGGQIIPCPQPQPVPVPVPQPTYRPIPQCRVSEWSQWSGCTATCGYGSQRRQRTVISGDWAHCSQQYDMQDSKQCKERECTVIPPPQPYRRDCTVSAWSAWSSCQLTCGGSCTQFRGRSVVSNAQGGGAFCPNLRDEKVYQLPRCPAPPPPRPTRPIPVDCIVTAWSTWSSYGSCSRQCGGSCETKRTRDIQQYPANGGQDCPELEERSSRPLPECAPVDCELTEWSSWTHCDRTCGRDCELRRWRTVTRQPEHGGTSCDYFELDEIRLEALEECPVPVDCEVSSWSDWSTCSQSCGGDCQVERNREIHHHGSHGGRACSTYNLREVETKVLEHCPIDCQMSEWSDWSQCIQTCGHCESKRWRSVIRHDQFGGRACGEGGDSWFGGGGPGGLEEIKDVPMSECPIPRDAIVTEWSQWSQCAQTCGYCPQSRSRSCESDGVLTGRRCDTYSMQQSRQHDLGDCPTPRDCVVSAWSGWSSCSQTCGACQVVKYRQIVSEAENGGRPCSDQYYRLAEARSDNLGECPRPINCEVSSWSSWSGCTATCGVCSSTRRRSVNRYPANGGSPCPSQMTETTTRQQRGCPKDCILSEWSAWTGCSRSCGHCNEYREKGILQEEEYGGRSCGEFCVKDQRRTPLPPCKTTRRRRRGIRQ